MKRARVVVFDLFGNVRFVSGIINSDEIKKVWNIVKDIDPALIDGAYLKMQRDNLELIVKMSGELIAVLWYGE